MKNDYKIFNNPEFGDIRVLNIDGNTWFVAKDVCDVLSIVNHKDAISSLDEDEKGVASIYPLSKTKRGGGLQKTNIINESGLYTLIFQSRKPFAKSFRKWVTSEVLPTIHKTGCFRLAYPYQKEISHLKNLREIDREKMKILQDWVLNIQSERDLLLQHNSASTEIVCTRDFSESESLVRLGKFIKSLCSERNLTPFALCRLMGEDFPRTKLLGFEKGEVDISLTLFLKLLTVMDYSLQFVDNKKLVDYNG